MIFDYALCNFLWKINFKGGIKFLKNYHFTIYNVLVFELQPLWIIDCNFAILSIERNFLKALWIIEY